MLGSTHSVVVEIGGVPVALRTREAGFARVLAERYAPFLNPAAAPAFDFELNLVAPGALAGEEDVRVEQRAGRWQVRRGDFRAEWDLVSRRGSIRQSANPYGVDSLLRILHTLVLARQGGFLVHAASAVRNARAFVFAGRSGAGKTTLARLAPPDVRLLSDEISYVRRVEDGYRACGTPFAGELARLGENLVAPLAAFYLLEKGAELRLTRLAEAEAVSGLLQNILFFAADPALVESVFAAVCEFVRRVPVARLTFPPQARVWEALA